MEINSQIGPYRIDGLLGQGGMAEVWKAWHLNLHCHHALKMLPLQMTFDKNLVERFLSEARNMAGLQHPNIATIHTVSEAECPQPYFAMELVEGGDLSDLLAERRVLPLPEALPILQQIGAALDYAHSRGLIHRDVKPGNVLLKPIGASGHAVKVVDFGIARAQEDSGGKRLTKTGMIVGTPEYMSPEQGGSGAIVDHRTDQYSLGVIAYEMLCGQPPFKGASETSMIAVIMQHVRDEPRPPMELAPNLPAAANAAILKSLAKDPSDRFESCEAFLEALAGSVVVNPVKKASPTHQPPSQNNLQRRSFPLIPVALGVLVFLGAGLIGFGLNRGDGTFEVVPPPVDSVQSTPGIGDAAPPSPMPAQTMVSVPDLVGKTEEQAKEIIKAKSLTTDVSTGYSNAFAAQQVMSQDPKVGASAAKGATVRIRISMGPKDKPVAPSHSESPNSSLQDDIETKAVLSTVDNWRRAWERQDVDAYMSNYTSDASIYSNKKHYSYNDYYVHERELFSHGGTISVTRQPASVNINGDRATVSFRMTFQRWGGKGNYKSSGRQNFTMRKVDGGWMIENDTFSK